ncbi:phospholipid transporting ATPase [Scheffersomyces xylosifermentans]|uniref:phospholipid transporting ATPase n=1 Tax=Scheffersomyces xylosifermentans TaxID=1304137 RepID=UPI00315D0411
MSDQSPFMDQDDPYNSFSNDSSHQLGNSPPNTRSHSLRFELPADSSTQPHSASSNQSFNTNHSASHTVTSPFMDQHNTILEDEVFQHPPISPFARETFNLSNIGNKVDGDSEMVYDVDLDEDRVDRKETVMKRHRWGTTRNKHGRPKKENVNRSHTLKGFLSPNHSIRRKNNRVDSIRRPNTGNGSDEDITRDGDDDEHGSVTPPNETVEPNDRKEQKRTIVFNRLLPDEFLDPETGKPDTDYPRNKIRTTKYTPLSFLPKNIGNQFLKNVANIYFLTMIILGAFSIFGVPSPVLAAVPLIVIVIITAIKDAIEDSRRTVTDLEVNNQNTHILSQDNSNPNPEFIYTNNNVNDEKVSLWRRFKKLNTRLLIRFWGASKRNLTKEGRAEKERTKRNLELQAAGGSEGNNNARRSFDSDITDPSPRNSLDLGATTSNNPFGERLRKSFQQQRSENNEYHRHTPKTLKFARKYWKDVKVGDMLRIYNNDEIPADVIILATSDEDNCCYVETKNLDGETNLKVRQALKYSSLEQKIKRADDLIDHEFEIDSEGPHANLYSYQGNLRYVDPSSNEEKQEAITINNVLLRGCSLRNTKWVIGIVAFTGDDTKIMMNAGVTPTKQSRISRELNYYVLLNFIFLFLLCFISGLVNGLYYRKTGSSRDYFEFGTIAGSPALNGLVSFFVAVILYQSLVPISLYITIEIIKTAQAFFIYSDLGMYYERLDYPCTPKSWSISDDLGQIEYVFSDKTGTLTQNLMEFKKCTINGISYGKAYTEALAGLRKRQGIDVETEAAVERGLIAQDKEEMIESLRKISKSTIKYEDEITFVSSEFVHDIAGASGKSQKECNEHFMLALALCHSVLTEQDPKNPSKTLLKAQSPDEAALVGTARSLGYVFKGNTKKGLILEVHGVTKEYQVLNTLEFNSTRKRMSAIIKIPSEKPDGEPKALLICKGADSIIYGRLSKTGNDRKLLDKTSEHLEEYATEGLRTLCIAERELTWDQYNEWNRRHQAAASSLDDREAKMEAVADSIERELILLGGTAIEDRLQDGVPDSISILGQAGIKLWVLTGDKVETAINIGFSCNLLGNDMELLVLKTKLTKQERGQYEVANYEELSDDQLIDTLITHYLDKYFNMTGSDDELEAATEDHSPPNEGFGVVIDGDALKIALLNPGTKRKFLLLCKQCKAVLCCRVSPAQKAAVVKLVKDTLDVMTLAIGDGSNDVAMIQAADVGVGIAGEEGRQAVMSSDYAIGQFRFLARLLLTHGRWSYKRFSEMIPSFFYKNVIFNQALFWYGIYNNFDGSYLFEFTYLMFYNLAFTSLPIIFLGVFDQDLSAKVSLLVPQIYRSGILRSEFTQKKFWWYMLDAVYQSLISFYFPYLIYYVAYPNANGLPLDHRFWMGVTVTCISCISCNLYILSHQYRWDWISSLIVAISILIIFIWTGLWTVSTYSGEFYKAAPQVFGTLSFWACMFVGILFALIPRFFYDFVQKIYWPKDVDVIRECVNRGDFDAYPFDYDPTDPHRIKISNYTNETVKRMSVHTSSVQNSPIPYKKKANSDSSGSDVDQLQREVSLTQDDNDTMVSDRVPYMQPSPIKSSVAHPPPQQRKSIIDIFKRKSQGVSGMSFYDNGSLLETYHHPNGTTDDLSRIETEEIAMEDFSRNREHASRISTEQRRISSSYGHGN